MGHVGWISLPYAALGVAECLLLATLPVAMIETNLRRSWKDAACWAVAPAALFAIGFLIEVGENGLG
jgi:hypothetical protein